MSGHTASGTGTVGGGAWSVTGIDLTSMVDGDVITYTVVATDASGNHSTSVSAFATKDTVAPSVVITFRTNPIKISNVTSAARPATERTAT